MQPHVFEDAYKDNGDLLYSQTQQPAQNQLAAHYAHVKKYMGGRTAVDIGSRFGEYTHYLLKHYDHVVCFEPNVGAVNKFFNRNIPKQNVTVYTCGIGNVEETVSISGGISGGRPCRTLAAL